MLRHAHADSASIALVVDGNQLQMKITDTADSDAWTAGVGLSSMRRAGTALGG